MKKHNIRLSVIVRVALLALAVVLCIGVFGCAKAPIQHGDVDQTKTEEDLNIRGTIKFTVNNESGTADEAMAPRNVVNKFMEKYTSTKVVYEEANRSTYPARISAGDIGDVFWVDGIDANN